MYSALSHPSAFLLAILAAPGGCTAPAAAPTKPAAQSVFDTVAPSVVAILNDDRADREIDIREIEKTLGDEARAPKRVVDVSLRKEPTPHGTGFMIENNQIVTAAHVVFRPDRLKITTRSGQTVEAELLRIDEVRDIAVLRPKLALKDVPPLPLETRPIHVGEPVWTVGHTGHGYWALSWGMSEGIASGMIDLFGAKLLLFDGAVYPGFSGGPVIAMEGGAAHVVGVNHAILFTGGSELPVAPISSAVWVSELREVLAGHPPAIEATLAGYAKSQRGRVWADVFITDRLSVSRDANDQQVAHIVGDAKMLEARADGTRIPAVAMVFGLDKGAHDDVEFEAHDPSGAVVASWPATVRVGDHSRVSFVSGTLRFAPKMHGKYAVVLKHENKEIGRSNVSLELGDDDDDAVEPGGDTVEDGDPDVDIVVAMQATDDPLALLGIRAGWAERSYPRRVGYTWFARGTRGWSGTNVSVTAFVLDEGGHIVGRSDGCFKPELRPEHSWSCGSAGGMSPPPLASKEGAYDIVFAINDRPVAWWPMEAAIRRDHAPGSDVERWMQEVKRVTLKKGPTTTAPVPSAPPPSAPPRPLPAAPRTPPKAPKASPKATRF